MTIEERDVNNTHGLPSPSTDVDGQLNLAIELNNLAKSESPAWSARVIEILNDYSPIAFTVKEARVACNDVMGLNSWKKVSKFVIDDMCSEFFNMALSYCIKTKQTHVNDLDFIDGSGIGYLNGYTAQLKNCLEKIFDAKWTFKKDRPLVHSGNKGVDLIPTANAIHPAHWTYPAGHGGKFLCAVAYLKSVFTLTAEVEKILLVAAVIAAHGRSGNLIHYPEDNCASISLFNL